MDGLSAAASVVALVQITASVGKLCVEYVETAKSAKPDIERLLSKLNTLKTILDGADKLLQGPHRGRLETSRNFRGALVKCFSDLKDLEMKLNDKMKPGKRGKLIRALKWPFEKNSIDSIVYELETVENALSKALQIDETAVVLHLNQDFHGYLERVDDKERIEILNWISDIQSTAHHNTVREQRTPDTSGAGKTFLASKVVEHVQSLLNASSKPEGFAFFYCNRNEANRQDPLSVLRSYVRQLSTAIGNTGLMRKEIRALYQKTREEGGSLGFDTCKEQLLDSVNLYESTTLVIDALDECDPNSRFRLVDTIKFLMSSSTRPLKVFISSRRDRDIKELFTKEPTIEIEARHNQEDMKKFIGEKIITHGNWRIMSSQLKDDIVQVLTERSEEMFQWVSLQIQELLSLESEEDIRHRLGRLPDGLRAAYKEIYARIQNRGQQDRTFANLAFSWVLCARQPLKREELLAAIRLDPNNTEDGVILASAITETQLLHLCSNLLVLDSQRDVWRFSHLSVAEFIEEASPIDLLGAHCYAAKTCLKLLILAYWSPSKESGSESETESQTRSSIDQLEPGPLSILDTKHELQFYARQYWMDHIQYYELHISGSGKTVDPILMHYTRDFLGSFNESSLQYQAWYRQAYSERYRAASVFKVVAEDISSPKITIFVICRLPIDALLREWWDTGEIDLSKTTERGDDLLTLAAAAGSRPICQTLLNRGAVVNRSNGRSSWSFYGSALAAAALKGQTAIVKFLVEQGAKVNSLARKTLSEYVSALEAAAGEGHIHIVKFLVEHEADVNLTPQSQKYWYCEYGSALEAAAGHGHVETVKFLVEHGARTDLVHPEGWCGSALGAALSYRGENSEILEFLVNQGANVNRTFSHTSFGSPLAVAAERGKVEIVKWLVEKGAEINTPLLNGDYANALTAAAESNIAVVKFLLEHGADINLPQSTQNGKAEQDAGMTYVRRMRYASALAAAAYCKKVEVIQLLLEKGADVNMDLGRAEYGSALSAAAARGEISIVELLLERGAAINMALQSSYFGSALATAAWHKKTEIVRLLVKQGSEIMLQGGEYGSALGAASYIGELDIVKFFVEKGVDINSQLQYGWFGSALASAAWSGEDGVVKFLVENGAEVNMMLLNGNYGSALAAASDMGQADVVELLVEEGAEVNLLLQSGEYGSALAAASHRRDTKVIDFLIEKGAEVNMVLRTGRYGSALASASAAIHNEEINIIDTLVQKGAEVNLPLQSGYYGSALAAAASERMVEHVNFLLQKGADVNMPLQSGNYGNAFIAAAEGGNIDIIQCLLTAGANVNQTVQVGKYGTALIAASHCGRRKAVKVLVEAGAQVDAKISWEGQFYTALQAAKADVLRDDQKRIWRGWDVKEKLKRRKAEVAELLRSHGAIDEI